MRFTLDVEQKHSSMILGITLRYARLKAGLSLRDMGELANISHTLIANIENGKTVANHETLRDMFSILKMNYRDDPELISEFKTLYERVFNHLYQFHYDRTFEDIKYLEDHESMYLNSIVLIDYSLLRFLHAALTDTMSPYLASNLDLMKRVSGLFSPKQQQLRHLIIGVHLFNQGQFKESYDELLEARKIGDNRLDPLINLFVLRNQVRMFMFMDAQATANDTIKRFEEQLNYQRAMQIRLAISYSHISLKKFDEALQYIEYVEHYGMEYQHDILLRECVNNRLSLYMMKGDFDTVKELLHSIQEDDVVSLIARMVVGGLEQRTDDLKAYYDTYLQLYKKHPKKREYLFVTGIMMVYQGLSYTEEEFLALFEEMIEVCTACLDQEVLMFGFNTLIDFYKEKRMYKKALELSEKARGIRSYGTLVD